MNLHRILITYMVVLIKIMKLQIWILRLVATGIGE